MAADVIGLMDDLTAADPRAAVWCATQCLRTVLPLADEVDDRPRRAVEAAEGWARGWVGLAACRAGAAAAAAAWIDDVDRDPTNDCISADAFGCVAHGARMVCNAAYHDVRGAVYAVSDVARAAASVTPAVIAAWHDPDDQAFFAERDRVVSLSYMFLQWIVSTQRWSATVPDPLAILTTPHPGAAVAWDVVATDRVTDLTMVDLVAAHRRSVRLGLDWSDPLERAVAERALAEDRIRTVLAAEGGGHG